MLKIGVMVSGGGTNLQAILDRIDDGTLQNCRVVTVVSSREGVYALERANSRGIPTAVISRKVLKRSRNMIECSLITCVNIMWSLLYWPVF